MKKSNSKAKQFRIFMKEEIDNVVHMISEKKMKIDDVAKHYKTSSPTLRSICKENGISIKDLKSIDSKSSKIKNSFKSKEDEKNKILSSFEIKNSEDEVLDILKVDPVKIVSLKRTYERCRAAISENGNLLCRVPDDFIDQDMVDCAIRSDRRALSFVPEKFKTYNMCLRCVKEDGNLLSQVPLEFVHRKNGTLLREALNGNLKKIKKLDGSIINKLSYDDWISVVRNNFRNIKSVPVNFQTEEMLINALTGSNIFLRRQNKNTDQETMSLHNWIAETITLKRALQESNNGKDLSFSIDGGITSGDLSEVIRLNNENPESNKPFIQKAETIIKM